MDEYAVHYTDKSEKDLWDIQDYIAEELMEPLAALQKVMRIVDAADEIGLFPLKYPLVSYAKYHRRGLRMKAFGGYIILYRVNAKNKTVRIVRSLNGCTDWQRTILKLL